MSGTTITNTSADPLGLFFAMCIAHFLCDFPLQGEFLAKMKVDSPERMWCMTAHVSIQAGGVWAITGSGKLAAAEFLVHFLVDVAKAQRCIGFSTDQWLHIACKGIWAVLA